MTIVKWNSAISQADEWVSTQNSPGKSGQNRKLNASRYSENNSMERIEAKFSDRHKEEKIEEDLLKDKMSYR